MGKDSRNLEEALGGRQEPFGLENSMEFQDGREGFMDLLR
jgi:hypothetical protein